MKKRLLDVARVILDKFTNRYHEYYDFWGISVLYTHAKFLNKSSFSFNLLYDFYDEDGDFLEKVHKKFHGYLDHYLKLNNKSRSDLNLAVIKIKFDIDNVLKPKTLYGDYFHVEAELIDEKGNHFTQTLNGYCYPHTQWIKQRNFIDSLPLNKKNSIGKFDRNFNFENCYISQLGLIIAYPILSIKRSMFCPNNVP